MCFDTLGSMESFVNNGGEWQREKIALLENLCRSYDFSGLDTEKGSIRVLKALLGMIP